MLLKGLPAEYNAFVAVVTQNEDNYRDFSKFKVSLKNFEDTLRNTQGRDDSIMRSSEGGNRHGGSGGGTCYACNGSGHKAPNCKLKKDGKLWCKSCKSKTHNESACKKIKVTITILVVERKPTPLKSRKIIIGFSLRQVKLKFRPLRSPLLRIKVKSV